MGSCFVFFVLLVCVLQSLAAGAKDNLLDGTIQQYIYISVSLIKTLELNFCVFYFYFFSLSTSCHLVNWNGLKEQKLKGKEKKNE